MTGCCDWFCLDRFRACLAFPAIDERRCGLSDWVRGFDCFALLLPLPLPLFLAAYGRDEGPSICSSWSEIGLPSSFTS